jgi:hypothetical protein
LAYAMSSGFSVPTSVPHHYKARFCYFLGLPQLPDSAIIHVIWHPDNCAQTTVPNLGSGGIKGDRHVLIDLALCTIDRTAHTTLTDTEAATVTASGMFFHMSQAYAERS